MVVPEEEEEEEVEVEVEVVDMLAAAVVAVDTLVVEVVVGTLAAAVPSEVVDMLVVAVDSHQGAA